MSAASDSRAGGGAVLRGVALDAQPRVLRRPGALPARAAGASIPGSRGTEPSPSAPPPPVPPESLPGYADGLRAGFAQGEAAQRARELGTLEASRRMGFEQGREEGRQAGLAEGRAAARAEVEREAHAAAEAAAARMSQLDRLVASIPAEITRRLEQAEDDMVALCHAVVCRILGDELVTPGGVAEHVRQAIREVGPAAFASGRGQLAIHVHPGDLAALEADAVLAAWLRQHASAGAVQWIPDGHVRLGGCLVRSAEGALDARLETQLDALHEILTRKRGQGAAAPSSGGPAAPREGA